MNAIPTPTALAEWLQLAMTVIGTVSGLGILWSMSARLGKVEATTNSTAAKVDRLEPIISDIRVDVAILKVDVAVLKVDVGVLKEDVTVLKQDVTVLKQDVTVLKQDVTVLKQDVSVLKENVTSLDNRYSCLSGKVDRINRKKKKRYH